MRDEDLRALKSDIAEAKSLETTDIGTLLLAEAAVGILEELKELNGDIRRERDRDRISKKLKMYTSKQ